MELLLPILAVVLLVGGVGVVAAAGIAVTSLLYICEPNEVLIISGKRRLLGDGREARYRTIKGGRVIRTPLVERVDRLDLTNMIIDVSVQNAYSKGGIPLHVQGVANVKIAGYEPQLSNAVERLLGKSREEVMKIASNVLEGNLRGVLSQLTPEQVNEDKLAFAEKLLEEAEHDLSRLGLVLDSMKIQNVSDDRGYLDAIGRQKSADLIKRARIAEAKAKAEAMIRDAENRRRARLAEIDSQQAIAVAEAERRIGDAQTRGTALIAEQEGQVAALLARAEAALGAEEARVEQTRRRLEADVIEPARASMEAGIAEAKGNASRILEDGRASVQVLEEMIRVWKEGGRDSKDIFLMQKLQAIMDSMAGTIGTVKVDRLTMLPDNDGSGSTARTAVRLVEELKGALGVDLPKLLETAAQGRARGSAEGA
jgi:flotillin